MTTTLAICCGYANRQRRLDEALFSAVAHGDDVAAIKALNNGASPQAKACGNRSYDPHFPWGVLGIFNTQWAVHCTGDQPILVRAARSPCVRTVAELIQRGAAVNAPNTANDETPLMAAAAVGSYEAVHLLVKHGANVNYVNRQGWTALATAVGPDLWESAYHPNDRRPAVKIALYLLAHGAKPGQPEALNPLWPAAGIQPDTLLKPMLARGADVNGRWLLEETPLFAAVFAGRCDTASILLDAGADPNATNSIGVTPLHYAALGADPKMVRLLLHRGANPGIRDHSGRTPLNIAQGSFSPSTSVANVAEVMHRLRDARRLSDTGASITKR